MSIFVPTTLINLIGFATFFYKWFDFQNRIMVSLTSLLVLSTLFSQVSSNLPKTSYLKLVDIWFIISIFYCFSIILTHVLVEVHHKYSNPTEIAIARSWGQINRLSPSDSSFSSFSKVHPAPNDRKHSMNGNQELPLRAKNDSDPFRLSKKIDRIAFRATVVSYAILFIGFWIVAFLQRIQNSSVEMENTYDDIVGYP